MRFLIFVFVVVLSLIGLTSCSGVLEKLDSKVASNFREEMTSRYKNIKNITMEFNTPWLKTVYTFKEKPTDEQFNEICNKSKEFLSSDSFQKEFQEEFFRKINFDVQEEKVYPTIYLYFDFNNDENIDKSYEARYYKDRYSAGSKNESDGYKTWRE